jgi:hypothetical protein
MEMSPVVEIIEVSEIASPRALAIAVFALPMSVMAPETVRIVNPLELNPQGLLNPIELPSPVI